MLIAAVVEAPTYPRPQNRAPRAGDPAVPSLPLSISGPPPVAQAVIPRERAVPPVPIARTGSRQIIPVPSIAPVRYNRARRRLRASP